MDNTISEINGVQLYNSFIAGAQKIFENQALLNNINFYPVPDADTGTNLASTMHSIVSTVQPQENVKETALALADAALMGARGNSGIIFAQFLYGFSKDIREQHKEFHANGEKAIAALKGGNADNARNYLKKSEDISKKLLKDFEEMVLIAERLEKEQIRIFE